MGLARRRPGHRHHLDPIRAIFEKYYFDAPSPRVFPSEIADAWFRRKASEVDGVIFYLPQEDDVIGWDYPRLRAFLDERAIPHLMLRAESSDANRRLYRKARQQMAEKQLESTVRAAAYQKAWFAQLREDVFEKQKPYAIVQADMPLELFHAMDVPVVSNQWWAAMVAAKRLAPYYLDGLNALGYHDGLCRYCSLSLASTIAGDPAQAPWGGLPKPALAFRPSHLRLHPARFRNLGGQVRQPIRSSGCSRRVRTAAALVGTEPSSLERALRKPSARFHGGAVSFAHRGPWNTSRETAFDIDRLRTLMEGVNRQEQYFEEVRDMICQAPKTPVRMHEQVSNVMAAQWLRGSDWAIAHARAFRDEVKERVDSGVAACPSERLRLDVGGRRPMARYRFLHRFRRTVRRGVCVVHVPCVRAGRLYSLRPRTILCARSPAAPSASTSSSTIRPGPTNGLSIRPRQHRIDAALVLEPLGTRPSATGNRFIERALEASGHSRPSDCRGHGGCARSWNGIEMRQKVSVSRRINSRPRAIGIAPQEHDFNQREDHPAATKYQPAVNPPVRSRNIPSTCGPTYPKRPPPSPTTPITGPISLLPTTSPASAKI